MQWKGLLSDMEGFEEEFYAQFLCDPGALTAENIKSGRSREALMSGWVLQFAKMYTQCKPLISSVAATVEELNSRLLKSQEKVIALQEDLIKIKDEQLASVQSTVREQVASVQTAVKSEISAWSDIVQKNAAPHITPTTLREAVRSFVVEEDRSRNIMIFGKEDSAKEELSRTVTEVFEDMAVKPRLIECRRVGTVKTGKSRPIKVKLSSSDAVFDVLLNAKVLKTSDRNRLTYVSPDRTEQERGAHKSLVVRMKEKMKNEPGLYHCIRGGRLTSVKRAGK